jgi:hypothetical protein
VGEVTEVKGRQTFEEIINGITYDREVLPDELQDADLVLAAGMSLLTLVRSVQSPFVGAKRESQLSISYPNNQPMDQTPGFVEDEVDKMIWSWNLKKNF